jgi:hypothetical protein
MLEFYMYHKLLEIVVKKRIIDLIYLNVLG